MPGIRSVSTVIGIWSTPPMTIPLCGTARPAATTIFSKPTVRFRLTKRECFPTVRKPATLFSRKPRKTIFLLIRRFGSEIRNNRESETLLRQIRRILFLKPVKGDTPAPVHNGNVKQRFIGMNGRIRVDRRELPTPISALPSIPQSTHRFERGHNR